jgi:hypothetical protein
VPFLSFFTRISFSFDELFDALDAGSDTAAVADCSLLIDSGCAFGGVFTEDGFDSRLPDAFNELDISIYPS